MTPVL